MLNGWAQGMGFPPCAGSFALVFAQRIGDENVVLERLALVGICGHSDFVRILARIHQQSPPTWEIGGFVFSCRPASRCVTVAMLFWHLRDTPESIGLPEVAGTHVAATSESEPIAGRIRAFLWKRVFSDKYIWIVSAANFFVYVLRYASSIGGQRCERSEGNRRTTRPGWWPGSNSPDWRE